MTTQSHSVPLETEGHQSWQQTSGQSLPARSRWLTVRRVGSVVLILGLLGVMLSLLVSLKRYVPLVVGFATGYEQPYAPIPMSHEDRQLLQGLSLSPMTVFQPRVVHWQDASDELQADSPQQLIDALAQRCASTRPGGPNKDAVIAYLSMVGTVDSEGVACLVPPRIGENETLAGDDRFVSVANLITRIRTGLSPEVNLVLVLDACQGHLAWPMGLTEGSFAVAVQATLNKLQVDRTWVLVSAGPGECSNGDDGDGVSTFARFFAGGLEGAADYAAGGNRDGFVDLRELTAYLQAEVPRYTVSRYGVSQTPQVLPSPPEHDSPQLSWARPAAQVIATAQPHDASTKTTVDTVSTESEVDWWLRDRWLNAESLRATASYQRPMLWQQYQKLLLRAEALRTAGVSGQEQLGEVEVLTERLELELTSTNITDTQYLASLRLQPVASALQRETIDVDAWVNELKQSVFSPSKEKPTAINDDALVTADVWNQRADAAWRWLVTRIEAGGPVDAAILERWLNKLGSSGGALQAEPTQIHAARMLLRDLQSDVWLQEPELPGQLLRQIGRSREACFPSDVRADRMVALLTSRNEADRALRRAIDLTLVGDKASLNEAKQQLAIADAAFTEILKIGQQASAAYQSSDDLYDEFPWLIAWLARERRIAIVSGPNTSSEQTQRLASELNWQTAIDTVARFERIVGEAPRVVLERLAGATVDRSRLAEETLQRVEQASQEAFEVVAPIRAALLATVEELTASAPDSGQTLGRISRVLDTPLVRGQARLQLLERASRLRRILREVKYTESGASANAEARSPEFTMAAWTTWHDIAVHPIVPVFTTNIADVSTKPLQVEAIARSVGKQLAAVRVEIDSLAPAMLAAESQAARVEGEISVVAQGPEREAKRIESLIAIASAGPQWRRLAGILTEIGMTRPSPVRKSLLAAWHDRLVNAASDALEDFWAGAQPKAPVWCLGAANGFLEKAEEVVREARIEHGTLYRRNVRFRLRQLESLYGVSAGEGTYGVLQLDPRVIRLFDSRVLQDSPPNIARLVPEPGVPTGVAALQFSETSSTEPWPLAMDADGSPVLRQPIAVGTPIEPGVLNWSVSPTALERFQTNQATPLNAPAVIDAIASFRGHRLVTAAPLALRTVTRVIDWERPKTTSPRVVVRGEIPRNRAVAIVFDCSGSMGQRLPDGRTRLEAGRAALYDVLDAIARDGGWSVSLWLYGHRTRWTQDERGEFKSALTDIGKRAQEQALAAGDEFALVPGDDVEQVMRLQPLVPLQVARIRSLLDAVEPGGETPLYLAVDEATRSDFAGNPGPSHVLVVTDGANDQSGGKITTSSDVRRTLADVNFRRSAQDQVRIDVVGFQLQPGVYDRQIRLQDLQSVAKDSDGQFFDATDAQGLAAALRSSLGSQKWRVRSGGDEQPLSADLNQAIILEPTVNGLTQTYDVALDAPGGGPARRVSLSGGEAVELFVTGQGNGLEFRRYDGGLEQGLRDVAADLPDPVSADRRWFLGAHLARRAGTSVSFPLSVQNGVADGFSPKPTETWIEVQPVGPGGNVGLPYVFTDPLFQPNRPVPVLDLRAHDWPEAANFAEIRSWVRFDQTVPEVSLPVALLAPGVEKALTLPAFPNSLITARVAPLTSRSELVLTVVETHPREVAESLPLLKVSVSRGCTRAVHIVVPETGRARHEFTIEMIDEQVASDVVLSITDKRAIQRDAVGPPSPGAMPLPLRVAVPSQ